MLVISEGPIKITRSTIELAWKKRAKDVRRIIRDKERRGLALIVNETTMRWEYSYRPRGVDPRSNKRWPNRTVTIGDPSEVSPDDARDEANKVRGRVRDGGDPAADRKAAIEEQARKRSLICERLLDDYAKALPERPKMRGGDGLPTAEYVAVEVRQTRLAIEAIKAELIPVTELTAADVRKLVSKSSGKGGNAKARFGALSRFLDWCVDDELITVNPCSLLARNRRPRPLQARQGYLTTDRLAHLWKAADALREPVWRDIARFLIAVPVRRGEAAEVDWSHVDFASDELKQPELITKNGDPHRLHLHPLAIDILTRRWKDAGKPTAGLVFPGPRAGKQILNWGDVKSELDTAASLTGWIWHDLRRSFATALGEVGVSETVADAVLNHRQSATRGGVLGVYQRASRWPEQVKAMQLWGRLLAAAIEGREASAEVVRLYSAAS